MTTTLEEIGGKPVVRRPPVVGVLPQRVRDGVAEVLLIDQHRVPVGETVREIVAGKLDPPELGLPTEIGALTAARRELAEEAGLAADDLRPLISAPLLMSPGWTDERLVGLYLATGLAPAARRPEDAHIAGVWVPLADAVAQVGTTIVDTKTIVALLLAAHGTTPAR